MCFQVFLENPEKERNFTIPLPPVVSDPIFDKKAMSDLVICKMSDCTSTVAGGKEIILLCEKVFIETFYFINSKWKTKIHLVYSVRLQKKILVLDFMKRLMARSIGKGLEIFPIQMFTNKLRSHLEHQGK